jgi:titin
LFTPALATTAAFAVVLGSVLVTSPSASAAPLTGDVAIVGVASPGRTITANPSDWEANTLFDYAWSLDGTPTGAVTRNLKLPDTAQVDQTYSVTVTGHHDGFDDGTATAQVKVVAANPNAPTDLVATASGRDVTLTWTAPTNTGGLPLTTYRVDYRPAAGGAWTAFTHADSTATTITVTGLNGSTEYQFRVAARNSYGTSVPTRSATATTGPPDVPGTVSTPVATAGNRSASLTWNPPANLAAAQPISYTVECQRTSGTTNASTTYPKNQWVACGTISNAKGTGAIDYDVVGLPAYRFIFRVTASNASGDSAPSASSNQVTVTTAAPGRPSQFRRSVAADGMSITFTWRASTTRAALLDHYEIRWNGGSGSTFVALPTADGGIVPANATSYTWTGYAAGDDVANSPLGKRARYRLYACTAAYEDQPAVCATPRNLTINMTRPRVPTDVTATAKDGQAYVTWTPGKVTNLRGPAAYYQVQYRTGTGSWVDGPITKSNYVAVTVPGLTNGTSGNAGYQFRVKAVGFDGGDRGWSSASNRVNPAAGLGMAADDPSNAAATAGVEQVALTWEAPAVTADQPAATGYVVEQASSTDGPWSVLTTETGTSYTVTQLDSARSYYFRVRSLNANGVSAGAQVGPIQPLAATAPSVPLDVEATGQDTAVHLTWTRPADDGGIVITDYAVEFREFGTTEWIPADAPVDEVDDGDDDSGDEEVDDTSPAEEPEVEAPTEFTVTGLDNDTRYEFHVAAANHAGQSDWSDIVRAQPGVTADAPTNVVAMPGDSVVALTWQSPANTGTMPIVGWEISYRPQGSTGAWTVKNVDSNPNQATIKGLTNGTVYDFQVQAVTYVGAGTPGLASAQPYAGGPTVCNAPTNLVATPGNTMVGLQWTAPSDAATCGLVDYRVEYRAEGDDFWTVWADDAEPMTVTRATVKDLVNDQPYEFRVIAISTFGDGFADSDPSNIAKATPRADLPEVPYPPNDLWAEPAPEAVTLHWELPDWDGGSPITDYVVAYREKGAYNYVEFVDGTSTELTATVTGLDPAKTYQFRVAAVNAIGISDFTDAVEAQPGPATPVAVAPGAPKNLAATAGDARAALTWAAPDDDGGAPITGYTVQYRPQGATAYQTATATGTSTTVTGLTNGTTYEFQVAATNSAGTGPWSNVATAKPEAEIVVTVPGAAQDLQATAGDTTVALTWSAPANNGNAAITGYTVQYRAQDTDAWSEKEVTGTSTTVTGLTNGVTYEFRVAAENSAGLGAWSDTVTATPEAEIVETVPGAPTGLQATAGDAQVALSWTAPADTGNSPITSYTVRYKATDATDWTTRDVTARSRDAATSTTVTGLTNGTTYEFQVAAVNAIGAGPWSNTATATPEAEVTLTVPGAPVNVAATDGNAQSVVSWQPPADNGNAPITSYTLAYRAQGTTDWTTVDSTETTKTVTNLTNGTTYEFRVAAVNSVGVGPWSATVTATPAAPVTLPGAPTNVQATAGDAKADVTWSAPASDGGAPITGYTLRYRPQGSANWTTQDATTTSATVTGLTNGTTYEFQAAAKNSQGTGPWSASATATPSATVTVPGSPISLKATPGDSQVVLSWTAPANTGNAAITGYAVRYRAQGATDWTALEATATSATVTGLVNGQGYEFQVAAKNAKGQGEWSTAATATPNGPLPGSPSKPTNLKATAGNTEVALTWTAPATGAPFLSYTVAYRASGAADWTTVESDSPLTKATVRGLTNGTTYEFKVAATNDKGLGYYSDPATATPDAALPKTPAAPVLSATAGNTEVGLSWTVPDNGGSAIVSYVVWYRAAGAATWTVVETDNDMARYTVTGLTNGTKYEFRVAAVNGLGLGQYSNVAQATPDASKAKSPAAPINLTATAGNTEVGLTWTAPEVNGSDVATNIVTYVVAYKRSTATTWTTFETGSSMTRATVRNLTNGASYDFKVAAVNGIGVGPWSNQVSATPDASQAKTPEAPVLTATAGDGEVALHWTVPADNGSAIVNYAIWLRPQGQAFWDPMETFSTLTYYTFHALDNGTTYEFKVAAINGIGLGKESAVVTATPEAGKPKTPEAPVLTATPGNTEVGLSWTTPADNGSAITSYVVWYRLEDATLWTTVQTDSTLTYYTVRGLTNGTTYEFMVAAVNGVGLGRESAIVTATPDASLAKTPAAPIDLKATAGNTEVGLTWTAAADNGSPVTTYVVAYKPSSAATWTTFQTGSALTRATVRELTNGTYYDFKVAAINGIGLGMWSVTVSAQPDGSLAKTPAAPVVTATPGNAQVGLKWTVPADNGSPIDHYVVWYRAQGTAAWTTVETDSDLAYYTVTGLTNGTTYEFKVAAVNGIGLGQESAVVTATPDEKYGSAPAAPTNLKATPGNTEVGLTWTAPADNGTAVTDYVVAYKPADATTWQTIDLGSALTRATVRGLTNGTEYDFKVAAVNAIGVGPWSEPASATPDESLAKTPEAPVVTATPGNAQVGLRWTVPADNGSAITSYVIWYREQGTAAWTVVETDNDLNLYTVTGLTNGMTYEFKVAAVNGIGLGKESAVVTATPDAKLGSAPAAPTNLKATAGNTEVGLTWTAPADNGTPVTNYVVAYKPTAGTTWKTVDTESDLTRATIRGLTNGTSYDFKVAAVNAIGVGPWSAVVSATPDANAAKTPAAPTNLKATPGNAVVGLTWTAPADNGSAIVSYAVSYKLATAATWHTVETGSNATAYTVKDLTNDQEYEFKVAAINGIGLGLYSDVAKATPKASLPGVPAAPANVTATAGNKQVTVAWTAPTETGGSPITGYLVEYREQGKTTWTALSAGADATSLVVKNLVNGTPYEFRVTAQNAIGLGEPSKAVVATPTYGPVVTVTPTSVKPGDTITIQGTGFNAAESVSAEIRSDVVKLGTKATSDAGAVTFTWTVPTDFEPGTHQAVVIDAQGTEFKAQFTVVKVDLPKTGAGATGQLVGGSLAATALGLICLWIAARRREEAALPLQ